GRTERVFDTDEHVRPGITTDDLAKLRPAFCKDGSVTAGNASGINDGAGALVLMEAEVAQARGIAPLARIVATGLGGVAPDVMGAGTVPATRQAFGRARRTGADVDGVEANEGVGARAGPVPAELGLPPHQVNLRPR